MRTWSKNGAAVAVLFGLMWVVLSAAALADVKDYEFQLVQSEMKKGDGAIVAVRLVNKKSGKPVPDAVIFAKRIDMAPDAMQEMTAPLEQLPSTEPGVYRFKTDLTMQGRWRLSLGAKVQGEEGTVEASWFSRRCHEQHPTGAPDPRRHPGGGDGRILAGARRTTCDPLLPLARSFGASLLVCPSCDDHRCGRDPCARSIRCDHLLPGSGR